jgi:oligopeptidase A
MSNNPLLSISFEIPFDAIKAEHVEPAMKELIAQSAAHIEAIANLAAPRTYDNTMAALDEATEPLDVAINIVRHLESVATYPELRAAHNAVQPEVAAFYAGIVLNEGLWKALKAYAETDDAKQLTGIRKRFLEKTLDSFRRHGADLPEAGKKRLAEIDIQLTQLTTSYAEHVLDATNAFELLMTDEKQLAGLPAAAIAAAKQSADLKKLDGWRFTLQQPSLTAVLTYLDDAKVREQLYRANVTRASSGQFDNRELVVKVLALRKEKARLLEYQNFADLVLADRMAKTGARARSFLEDLKEKTISQFAEENKELENFRKDLEGLDAPPLQPWDIAYYAEKLRQKLYDFDEEILRPYFPMPKVLEGMFELMGRLFGIRVVEKKGVPVWHPDVTYYTINDAETHEYFGSFYADFYPRETKRGGAWMDAFLTGLPRPAGWEPHLGLICGNLTPPIGNDPALLTHRDVETIFHEFGHLLHHSLTRVPVRGLAGTNVPWDFVELPSQIMENWCWERPALDLFARHYQTGEPIPVDLFDKMRRAKNFRSANGQMRQLSFGVIDLALHTQYEPERDGDVIAYSRNILNQFSAVPVPEEHAMIASFTHLFAGPVAYASGYYSYKWAEVLDADAFTRFQHEGIFSSVVGREFRERILSRGDSEDPAVLYRAFMGRDPDLNALLRRSGLAA